MTVTYRSGTLADVPLAADLFVEAVNDLGKRNGLVFPSPDPASMVSWYSHLAETGIFEVAFEGETLVSFSSGIVRDGIFFLSMFWTKPVRQRQGVGRPLLARVWAEAGKRGAHTYSVWSSIDFAAIATYLRTGMRPISAVFSFGGEPTTKLPFDAELAPLDARVASELDQIVRGTARPEDHTFLLREKSRAHLVRRGERVLGYFYAHDGRIGPAAWSSDGDGPTVLAAALDVARTTASSVSISALGPNTAAIDLALAAGLRIQTTAHFLTSRPFGVLERYVPSGPALF